MYAIEKNIPMPKRRSGNAKYQFGEMEIGDSFYIPSDDEGWRVTRSGVRVHKVAVAASEYGKHHNKKFTVRSVPEGLRVWRIA